MSTIEIPRELSAQQASSALAEGALTAQELAQSCLDQVDALNGTAHAFIYLRPHDEILAEARRSDERRAAGASLGEFDGIPVGLKANYDDVNCVTSAGSKVLRAWVPKSDAEAVARLKESGAVIFGMLNMHEFANGPTGANEEFGSPVNPYDESRLAGGSSGGSALALATHMVLAATGTDTGGSIRGPASFCGVVGLKPTRDLVSTTGIVPFSKSLDHAGPMCAAIEDVPMTLRAMTSAAKISALEPHPEDASLTTIRFGIETDYFLSRVQSPILETFESLVGALETHGASVSTAQWKSVGLASGAALTILLPEAATVHHDLLESKLADYAEDVRVSLLSGRMYRAVDYVNAVEVQALLRQELDDIFEEVDVLLTPTVGIVAPRPEDSTARVSDGVDVDILPAITRLTVPFNLTGHPALTIPLGSTEDGLPFGLQLVGPHFSENVLLSVATQLRDILGIGSRPS